MNDKLDGKRVLVTAGAQGIGEAISRAFLDAGAKVALHYFSSSENAERIASEAAGRGGVAIPLPGDLRQKDPASRMVDEAANRLGGLDILINNAGSLVERKWLDEIAPTFWRKVMDINLSSMLYVSQAAAPYLAENEESSMVNLASLAGRKGGHPGSLAYATTKGAILTFTRALATELAPQGTRVNAVAPALSSAPRSTPPTHPNNRPGKPSPVSPSAVPAIPRTWPEPSFTWLPNTTVSSPAPPSTSTEASTPRRQNTRIN